MIHGWSNHTGHGPGVTPILSTMKDKIFTKMTLKPTYLTIWASKKLNPIQIIKKNPVITDSRL